MHKVITKSSLVRNMNTHLYSIKLFQNNFIILLHLYESLNYESSLMRNDYYILKDNARCRSRFVIIAIKKKDWTNNAKLSDIKIVKIEDSKLSNLETSLNIVTHYCDSIL